MKFGFIAKHRTIRSYGDSALNSPRQAEIDGRRFGPPIPRTARRAIRAWKPCTNCPSRYSAAGARQCRTPQISGISPCIPHRREGRIAVVTNVRRGAVDATVSCADAVAGRGTPVSESDVQDERQRRGRRSRADLALRCRCQVRLRSRIAR